ncbi:MAG: hypothetical protein ABI534_06315 [Chloroflexota bacterium]
MTWIIPAAVIAVLVALYLAWLPLLPALGLILLVLLAAAWRFDRARNAAGGLPYKGSNRPDFYGQSSDASWDVPTAYIDHPDGGGTPPGVERPGDVRPRRR